MDADAPQHAASRALADAARDSSTTLYVTSQILCEFYSIVTNARRVPNPRTPDEALRAIAGLLAFLVLPIPACTVEGWMDLRRRHPVTGGAVFDLSNRGDHAGQWNSAHLHFQQGRFRRISRACRSDSISAPCPQAGKAPSGRARPRSRWAVSHVTLAEVDCCQTAPFVCQFAFPESRFCST